MILKGLQRHFYVRVDSKGLSGLEWVVGGVDQSLVRLLSITRIYYNIKVTKVNENLECSSLSERD